MITRRHPFVSLTLYACIVALFPGCASDIVTHAVRTDRFEFNEAIARSWNEQMLLNLVRLRYRENPLFLEMGSVITGYSLKGSAGLTGGIAWAPEQTGDTRISLGGEYTIAPTLTYVPLQGEEFATRLLSPITPLTILYFSQSGWSLERLFTLCVQTANDIPNAVSAAGPTPDNAPDFATFHQLTEALRALQVKDRLRVALDTEGRTVLLYLNVGTGGMVDSAAETVRRLLNLDRQTNVYKVRSSVVREQRDEIAVMGRSILSVMFYLSQAVEVPRVDEAEGKVTVTRNDDGTPFAWSKVTGRVFHVHSSEIPPEEAFVRVHYRNHWFFISDSDLTSKTTFNLLTYLFNLKAAGKTSQEPFLIYPLK